MEKRIFIAVLISIALLYGWAVVAPKLFPQLVKPPAPKPATTTTTATTKTTTTTTTTERRTGSQPVPTPGRAESPPYVVTPVSAASVVQTTIESTEFTARFTNRGAELVSFQLRKYRDADGHPVELVKARDPRRTDYPFAIETTDAKMADRLNAALYQLSERVEKGVHILEYRYAGADGVSVTKTFRIDDEFLFRFAVAVHPTFPYRVAVGPGIRTLDPEEKDSRTIVTGNAVVKRDDKFSIIAREKSDAVNLFDGVQFIGVEDNYFLALLEPDRPSNGVVHAVNFPIAGSKEVRRDFYIAVNGGPDGTVSGNAFFGPKQTNLVDRYGFGDVLEFGHFGIISRVLLIALVWVNTFTRNFGWAIIVLTVIIKLVLYPLQHKSIVSMKKMQKLQPKMEQIKSRYKKSKTDPDQRQKMNMEMMNLYKVEGVNPMGGCLPMLVQLPILWGFYSLLSRAIELRGAPFLLWIHDLSLKDPYYITPALMTVTMFIQQWMTPTTADPAQRKMFMIMPIFFGILFKELPSGLVLYWLVQNILTIIQQIIMNKYWKDHPETLQKS
jgi:YidC/Oxa1 family membrane protein insertase